MTTDGKDQYWHVCGGTLITPNIIITAAHCRNTVKGAYIGNGGKAHHGRKISDDKRRYYTIKENDKYIHPKFDRKELLYDIMLIKLPIEVHEAPWKNEIFPKLHHYASIPTQKESLMVMGWGRTSTNGPTSSLLLTAKLDYISNQECKGIFGANMIDRSMLCAHSSKGRDACQGDSGGPLVMFKDGDTILLGLSSWGYVCAHPKYPGVYSRVSSSYNWITQTVCTKLSPESCDDDGSNNFRTRFVDPGDSDSNSQSPSNAPTIVFKSTPKPSPSPTFFPTNRPTMSPTTLAPTLNPTASSNNPTQEPTNGSMNPTEAPIKVTRNPTESPSESKSTPFESFFSLDLFSPKQESNPAPTQWPTIKPSHSPSKRPTTFKPTLNPSVPLSRKPTQGPSVNIRRSPTESPTNPPTEMKSSNGSSSFTLDFFFPEENSNLPPTQRPTVRQSQATGRPTTLRPPPRPASSFNLDMFFPEENPKYSPTQRPTIKVPITGSNMVGLDSMFANNNIQPQGSPNSQPSPRPTKKQVDINDLFPDKNKPTPPNTGTGFGLDSINFVPLNNPSSSMPPTATRKKSSGGFSLNDIGSEPP